MNLFGSLQYWWPASPFCSSRVRFYFSLVYIFPPRFIFWILNITLPLSWNSPWPKFLNTHLNWPLEGEPAHLSGSGRQTGRQCKGPDRSKWTHSALPTHAEPLGPGDLRRPWAEFDPISPSATSEEALRMRLVGGINQDGAAPFRFLQCLVGERRDELIPEIGIFL